MLRLFTYAQVDIMRSGKAWWHNATKRYDEARGQMRDLMIRCGEHDPEDDEYYDCADDVIDDFCTRNHIMFDKHGEPWVINNPEILVKSEVR